MVVSGGCRKATITLTPQSLTLLPSQYDTGGTVNIVCHVSALQSGDIPVVMTIIRKVGNTTTVLASASTIDTRARVEPTSGLTGASVTGGITKGSSMSTMTLTLTQARCDLDEGVYTCMFSFLNGYTLYRAYDDKIFTVGGKALTLQTL